MEKRKEEWQFVEGSPDSRYSISSYGRVWCNGYISITGRRQKAKELTQSTDTHGYKFVSLQQANGKQTCHLVHRLVAFAFCDGYEEGLDVCHGDGTRDNNHYQNLRWDTRANNSRDKIKDGTTTRGLSPKNLDETLKFICNKRKEGWLLREIAEFVNVSTAAISFIARGKTYKDELLALGLITQEQFDDTTYRERQKDCKRKYAAEKKLANCE